MKRKLFKQRVNGFSYTEMLVATFLIAIALTPAIESLASSIQSSSHHVAIAAANSRMSGKLEEVLSKSFSELEQEADASGGPTSVVITYSDVAGTPGRRLVYLARYDGDDADADSDPFTGVDQGLLWVRVQIENSSAAIQTLISE